ncbi:MAG: VOC family protein [Candidatus Omnitrophota bacterium]
MSHGMIYEGVNWFEIPVMDMDRAVAFYEAVFGIPMTVQTKGLIQMALWPKPKNPSGAGGSLIKVKGINPSHDGSLVYFTVKDIQPVLDKVLAHGGKILKEKMNIGEYGLIAHVADSEGNRVGIHQPAVGVHAACSYSS